MFHQVNAAPKDEGGCERVRTVAAEPSIAPLNDVRKYCHNGGPGSKNGYVPSWTSRRSSLLSLSSLVCPLFPTPRIACLLAKR
jgi:hypothetical protein